jgi:hypothetical protein
MSSDNELVGFLKEQAKIERKIVRSLSRSLSHIENPPVKGVLQGISLDSVKHEKLYDAAITMLMSVSRALTQENLDEEKELVKKHIQIEAELIEKIGKMLPTVKNEKVKLLLAAILGDERKHHKLLQSILEILVEGETITEADWWDMLWKESPSHGGTGG